MKLGLNYEIYYKNHLAGYIDKKDYEFMKILNSVIGLKTLLEIYFTGNRDLLEQTLGIETLLYMNEYLDYYLEIYESFNKPRKVVNEILDKSVFLPQRQKLDNFVYKINENIHNIFITKANLSVPIKK